MSNSAMTDYVRFSPNYSSRLMRKITKITIHHTAGISSVEGIGSVFADAGRQASANYGIGSDGRIGLYVDEKYRAWTSSNAGNDTRSVTIEVSNDSIGGNWRVSDWCFNRLIDLCVDICKRNGIKRLNFTGDASGNLTMHKYFAPTACPGPYLESKFPEIAQRVNKKLEGEEAMTSEERKEFNKLKETVESLGKENKDLKKRLDRYDEMGVYDNAAIEWAYIDGNLPSWAKPTIKKAVNKGYLKGNDNNSFELSRLFMRILVILDRAGALG